MPTPPPPPSLSGWGSGWGLGWGRGWGLGAGFGTGPGVGLVVPTRAEVVLGVVGGGVVGLVVAVVVVIDGTTTSVGVGLLADVAIGVLPDVEAGAGGAAAPIATSVTIEPTAEAGRMTFFGNRGAVGASSRDCPNPVCQSASATQRVIGQNNIAANPMAIPTPSHLRLRG